MTRRDPGSPASKMAERGQRSFGVGAKGSFILFPRAGTRPPWAVPEIFSVDDER